MILRPGEELKAAGQLLDLKSGAVPVVGVLQLARAAGAGRGIGQTRRLGQFSRRQGFVGDEQGRLEHGAAAGRAPADPRRRRLQRGRRPAGDTPAATRD